MTAPETLLNLITDYGSEMFRGGCTTGLPSPLAGDLLDQIRAALPATPPDREALRLAKDALENSDGILEGFVSTDANSEGAITEQMRENAAAIAALAALEKP